MTRIIAGRHKGHTLKVPQSVTRPTSSRVREAIFSSVEHSHDGFDGLNVLDLFAGSGALGLEAISRGAAYALMLEHDPKALAVIKDNIASLKVRSARVQGGELFNHLKSDQPENAFDIVFADPPYNLPDDKITIMLETLATRGWLAADALIVIERDKYSEFMWPHNFGDISQRSYGDTVVWYGRFVEKR